MASLQHERIDIVAFFNKTPILTEFIVSVSLIIQFTPFRL